MQPLAKVVLVRPKYEENVGLAARACANFGCGKLALVRPECDFRRGKAKARAMHGQKVLLKSKEYKSIAEATGDCSCVIATSAKARKNRKAIGLGEFVEMFKGKQGKIGMVFGCEPSGLSKDEVDKCDFVVKIDASEKYPTLNLSHAVCVMLYSLFVTGKAVNGKGKNFAYVKAATKKRLVRGFEKDLEKLPGIDDRAMVLASFKALVGRGLVSEKEAKALIAFFAKVGKGLN